MDDLLTGRVDHHLRPSATKPKTRFTGNGDTLLLTVDDDRFNQTVVETIMDHLPSVKVMQAAKPTSALEYIKLSKALPDILILDNRMPEMNGLELLRVLRRTFTAIQLPVIMLTGDTRIGDEVRRLAGWRTSCCRPHSQRES